MIGSTASGVVTYAHCPVFIIKWGDCPSVHGSFPADPCHSQEVFRNPRFGEGRIKISPLLESKGEIGFSIQSQVMDIKVVIKNFVDDAHF